MRSKCLLRCLSVAVLGAIVLSCSEDDDPQVADGSGGYSAPSTGGLPPAGSGGWLAGGTTGAGGTAQQPPAPSGGSTNAVPGDGATGGSTSDGGDDSSVRPPSPGDGGPCTKGTVRGSDVVMIGDSYIEIPGTLRFALEKHARDAGALDIGEQYRKYSVSGAAMASGAIPAQYAAARALGKPKVVIMDGGGNDILLLNPRCLFVKNAAKDEGCVASLEATALTLDKLMAQMATDGVEDVVFFSYPDVPAATGDILEVSVPRSKAACESRVAPRCHYVDPRDAFEGHASYIGLDGVHPTIAGAQVIADLVWAEMVRSCVAQ